MPKASKTRRSQSGNGPKMQPSLSAPLIWPIMAAAAISEAAATFFSQLAHTMATEGRDESPLPEPAWATPNRVALELSSMRLRDFSHDRQGPPTLICAPFALHGATIADFAPGHSLVEALGRNGRRQLYVTEWRSATPDMRFLSIDSYLADLNVAVDEVGSPVDLIGLCQGGWMALIYAARFPEKVRRLVLAGAPVDIRAAKSLISQLTVDVPLATFEDLVRLGEGRVIGRRMLEIWGPALDADETKRVLQLPPDTAPARLRDLDQRFRDWYAWTVDLPGTYYLQVVRWLFKENRIAEGRFVALGRTIDLAGVRAPVFLLAARDDELISTEQLFATARLIGTPKAAIEMSSEPCGHLSLFLGAATLTGTWRRIARWLGRDLTIAQAS